MKLRSALILSSLLLVTTANVGAQSKPAPDRVKRTFTVRGTFVGFEQGDYMHAIIKTSKGERTFFIGGAGLDYYLAVNGKKSGTFTIQLVDTFMEEAGGRQEIERMSVARIGKQSSTAWWSAIRKRMSLDAISQKYDPMVQKLVRNGG
jgi:hypothetical protein